MIIRIRTDTKKYEECKEKPSIPMNPTLIFYYLFIYLIILFIH